MSDRWGEDVGCVAGVRVSDGWGRDMRVNDGWW